MKIFTDKDIDSWQPCYPANEKLPIGWSGTVLDILDNESIPFQDRLWVVLRTDLLSEKLMRLFAVFCARQVQHLLNDKGSINAIDVAERYANGLATKQELDAARDAAVAAAWAAAWAQVDAKLKLGPAVRDAAREAGKTARMATQGAQYKKLREMILSGIKTGDVF